MQFYLYKQIISSQKDYVCFDFVPRHHNIIRFRRGLAVIKDDFSTVCSWVQFPNREEWKYDLFLGSLMHYVVEITFINFGYHSICYEQLHPTFLK